MAVTERRDQNPLVAAPQLVEPFDKTVERVKSSRSLHGRIKPFIGSSRACPSRGTPARSARLTSDAAAANSMIRSGTTAWRRA